MKKCMSIAVAICCVIIGFGYAEEHQAEKSMQIPIIGQDAPSFLADTTMGVVHFPEDFKGEWVILFSHPADFTPVCTTEFMTFASMQDEFEARNCKLIGLSIDSTFSHIAWIRTIKEKIEYNGMKNVDVKFPVIADLTMDVAKKYGMIQPTVSDTSAVRAVFIIDPNAKIRALLYYPLSNGRNMDEIKRLLIALQTTDEYAVATPANWQPGDDVIVPPPLTAGLAQERLDKESKENYYCLDWFICFKELELKD